MIDDEPGRDPVSMAEVRSTRRIDMRVLLLVLVGLTLAYQVVIPFAMIIWTSLKTARPGDPEFISTAVTGANYIRAFGDEPFWIATRNTLFFAASASLAALVPGIFLAWIIERSNAPFRAILRAVLIARIAIPGILITVIWILIASPNIGIINQLSRDWLGQRNIVNVYSFWGMVFVQAIEMVPLTYLLLAASLRNMDPRLEEAAIMSGASTMRLFLRISLPLSIPAVGAGLLLLFITTIETFEVPLLIGGRAGLPVFATEIFFNTSRTPVDWGIAATYSVALLAITVILLAGYFRTLRFSARFQTITGKDFKARQTDLGRWRAGLASVAGVLVFVITGVPLLMMLYASFLPFYRAPSLAAFSSMTIDNYTYIFANPKTINSLVNSTLVGLFSATVIVLFVSLVVYFVHRTRLPGRMLLDVVSFSPIAIPSVVLGATFMWFYLIVPMPIVGTLAIIVLAYFTKFMPFALRFISNSMLQIHPELEEAGAMSGASFLRSFATIVLPLVKPGLLAAWFWVMIQSFRELTVALMLARSENRTAAVLIFDLWDSGSLLKLSAFGVLIFVVLLLLCALSFAFTRQFGVDRAA